MKNIQLVHLSNGWTWSQNLWNPGELTYMSAPVSWQALDVLAGTSLDLPHEMLTLGPQLSSESIQKIPLFFPSFWALLETDSNQKTVQLTVTKTFHDKASRVSQVISKVRILPNGLPSKQATILDINPIAIKTGAVLNLSEYFSEFNRAVEYKKFLHETG